MTRLRALRRGDDSGAAAVEFAIVSLLLFVILFGIIEFSLVMRDKIAVTSAVRTGGRLASSEPRAPNLTVADPVTGTPAGITGMVTDTVRAVGSAVTGIPKESIQAIWVYQADANGNPPSGGFTSCSGNCVLYTYDAKWTWIDTSPKAPVTVIGGFRYVSGGWDALKINACPGDKDAQSVGVYLRVKHNFILGSFVSNSATIDLSDASAFRFEPIPSVPGPCKP